MIFVLNLILTIIINDKIDQINKLTSLAEKSFMNKNYSESIKNYKTLIDSLDYSNEKVFLNLAHAHLLSSDTLNAIENYNLASLTENNKIKSIAFQQLGNINEKNNKLNDNAGQPDQKKESDSQDDTKQNEQSKNDQKKSKEESIEEKLKKINMTKKKAEMILNALNNNEFQYIQQLKRKPSKKTDKTKPDW